MQRVPCEIGQYLHGAVFVGQDTRKVRSQFEVQRDVFGYRVWSEPFGKMNLEAMASGLAVVSSPRGGIPEVVGDAGILCEPEDVSGLADRIIEVLTDDCLRITLGQRARERAETLFTWDRAVAGIEEILRSLSCH